MANEAEKVTLPVTRAELGELSAALQTLQARVLALEGFRKEAEQLVAKLMPAPAAAPAAGGKEVKKGFRFGWK